MKVEALTISAPSQPENRNVHYQPKYLADIKDKNSSNSSNRIVLHNIKLHVYDSLNKDPSLLWARTMQDYSVVHIDNPQNLVCTSGFNLLF